MGASRLHTAPKIPNASFKTTIHVVCLRDSNPVLFVHSEMFYRINYKHHVLGGEPNPLVLKRQLSRNGLRCLTETRMRFELI